MPIQGLLQDWQGPHFCEVVVSLADVGRRFPVEPDLGCRAFG